MAKGCLELGDASHITWNVHQLKCWLFHNISKVSGGSGKVLECFRIFWKVSRKCGMFLNSLESSRKGYEVFGESGKFLNSGGASGWKISELNRPKLCLYLNPPPPTTQPNTPQHGAYWHKGVNKFEPQPRQAQQQAL